MGEGGSGIDMGGHRCHGVVVLFPPGFAFGGRKSLIPSALIAIATLAAVLAGAGTRSASASVDGNECRTYLTIDTHQEGLTLVHKSTWDTNFWAPHPLSVIRQGLQYWASEGGLFRGCHSEVKYDVACMRGLCEVDRFGSEIPLATVEISETMPWSGSQSSHCSIRSLGDCRFPKSRCIHFQRWVRGRGTFGALSLTEFFCSQTGAVVHPAHFSRAHRDMLLTV